MQAMSFPEGATVYQKNLVQVVLFINSIIDHCKEIPESRFSLDLSNFCYYIICKYSHQSFNLYSGGIPWGTTSNCVYLALSGMRVFR